MDIEITRNEKAYISTENGYYGVRVEKGSADDNTGGGYHMEYLQYAEATPLVLELRALLPEFAKIREARREAAHQASMAAAAANDKRIAGLRAQGLCQHCGSFCDGDCGA